jgi:hypothetical protein
VLVVEVAVAQPCYKECFFFFLSEPGSRRRRRMMQQGGGKDAARSSRSVRGKGGEVEQTVLGAESGVEASARTFVINNNNNNNLERG